MQNIPRLKENHRNFQIVKPMGIIWFEPNIFHLTASRTEALTQWKENKQRQLVELLCLFDVSNYITLLYFNRFGCDSGNVKDIPHS